MTLIDDELIEVSHNGKLNAHTPHTMGMMYKGKPSKSWELLIELCERNGRIDYVTDLIWEYKTYDDCDIMCLENIDEAIDKFFE